MDIATQACKNNIDAERIKSDLFQNKSDLEKIYAADAENSSNFLNTFSFTRLPLVYSFNRSMSI